MPYFVYKIFETPIRRLEKLEQHDAFREASNRAKQIRSELPADAACTIKMIFAENGIQRRGSAQSGARTGSQPPG